MNLKLILRMRSVAQSCFAMCAMTVAMCAIGFASASHAQIYKCTKDGKVEYANSPCDKEAKPVRLKGNVTVLGKEAFVGKKDELTKTDSKADGKGTILGIKPLDPIGDCTKKGGKIDKELRACIIP